jgi:hypothetical protein
VSTTDVYGNIAGVLDTIWGGSRPRPWCNWPVMA